MLSELTRLDFAGQVDTVFRLQAADGRRHELALRQVQEHPAPPEFESFSLLFLGPAEPFLGQGTFPMQHDRLGDFDLFIVPIGTHPSGGFVYEAVFNRLSQPKPGA